MTRAPHHARPRELPRPASRSRPFIGIGIAFAVGCAQPGSSRDAEPDALNPREARGPSCRALPRDGLLTVFGDGCPFAVTESEGGVVVLAGTDPDRKLEVRGAEPEVCNDHPCRFEGHATPQGPGLLVVVPSPASEMPRGVHFGWIDSDGSLRFVDLWAAAGPSVQADLTPLGPVYGLAPFVCGDALAFFAERRLEMPADAVAPPELQARQGVYRPSAEGWDVQPADPRTCLRLNVPLP